MTEGKKSDSQILAELIQTAKEERQKVTNSDDFIDLSDDIEDLQEKITEIAKKQAEMLEEATSMELKANHLKKDLITSGKFDTDLFKVKTKNSGSVNSNKFYETVGNHDEFLSLISITQKVVKDYAKDITKDDEKTQKKEKKKAIESCIETTQSISDLELI